MDKLNSLARDLEWGDRMMTAQDYLNPPRRRRKWVPWAILIAFLGGIIITSVIFYSWDSISGWFEGLLGS